MKNTHKQRRKGVFMFLTLAMLVAMVSSIVIFGQTTASQPAVNARQEAVAVHNGNQIYRMVVSASAPGGFTVFGAVMSYDNRALQPVDNTTHADITPESGASLDHAPFRLLASGFSLAPDAWLVYRERTGFSFDAFVFGQGGVTTGASTDMFAFYFRLLEPINSADLRFESSNVAGSLIGTNAQTSFVRPGILITSGGTNYVWGPNTQDQSNTEIPNSNVTINFAAPTPSPTPSPTPPSATVILTLQPSPGTLPADVASTITNNSGAVINSLPSPTRQGYTFDGWLYNGSSISVPFTISTNMTLTAGWTAVTVTPSPTPSPTPPSATVILTLQPSPGTLPADVASTITNNSGTVINSLPSPTRQGYTFNGWLHNGASISVPFTISTNMTLTARWTAVTATPSPTPSPTPPSATVTLTMNPSPGNFAAGVASTITNSAGSAVNSLPSPTRPGYTFDGWLHNGSPLVLPFTITTNMTLTARWTVVAANHHIVTFDAGLGTWPAGTQSSFTGQTGFSLLAFPTPTRPGFVFSGWTLNGANTVAPLTVNQNLTLQAVWTPAQVLTTPTPPTPTPAPATPTPCPSPTPSPSPSTRPNPQTNPINMSFAIFGAVMLVGVAGFGIVTLSKKHVDKVNQFDKDTVRHNREDRIVDMIEK